MTGSVKTLAGSERPSDKATPLLEVTGLKKHFPIRAGLFNRTVDHVYAVDGVSFFVNQGETLGLVGRADWQVRPTSCVTGAEGRIRGQYILQEVDRAEHD